MDRHVLASIIARCYSFLRRPATRSAALLASMVFSLFFFVVHPAQGATRTWDGGGTDGTCGGGAGDGNKWSCAANWSSDLAPGAGDTAVFSSTSTKDATINSAFTIQSITISTGYTGTITQSADLTLTAATGFTHSTTDGVFTWSSGTLSFTGAAAQTFNVDTDDTFGPVTINKTTSSTIGVTVTSGDTVSVSGDLTLTDGNLNTGTIAAAADVIHASTFDGGTGVVQVIGASVRTIDLTGGGHMPSLYLDGSGATTNGPSSGIVRFDGDLTMSDGIFNRWSR